LTAIRAGPRRPSALPGNSGTDPDDLIHEPSVGVVGTKGDSQCYLGVADKVEAIHAHLKSRIGSGEDALKYRLVQPEFTIATSDGIRNGTREMRYSLLGREVTNDALCEHLEATGLAGTIAVVACDKPPVGTLAAMLEHNEPAIIMSDGTIRPGHDPETGETLDIVSAYQVAGQSGQGRARPHRLQCLPGHRQLRRHVHLQHHADLHRRCRPAAPAYGGSASDDRGASRNSPQQLVSLSRRHDGKGPEATRHRQAGFAAQRGHRRHGHRRLHQCGSARSRNRPRGRLRTLLARRDDPGGVQSPVAATWFRC
jgi:hypothetical protein